MTRLHFARLTLVLLFVFASTAMLQAQAPAQAPCNPPPCSPQSAPSTYGAWEAYVFGGGYWSGTSVFDAKIPGGGTWGGKVGGYLSPNFKLDGGFSWYNHFAVGDPDNVEIFRPVTDLEGPKVRSTLWEGSGTWNFGDRTVAGSRFSPYLTLGLGVMIAKVKDGDSVFDDFGVLDTKSVFVTGGGLVRNPMYISPISVGTPFIANPARRIVMDSGDAFLTFSYGGGLKALRLWGPTGFQVDFRGRTIPNFYSKALTRPELTAGLVFAWGE